MFIILLIKSRWILVFRLVASCKVYLKVVWVVGEKLVVISNWCINLVFFRLENKKRMRFFVLKCELIYFNII